MWGSPLGLMSVPARSVDGKVSVPCAFDVACIAGYFNDRALDIPTFMIQPQHDLYTMLASGEAISAAMPNGDDPGLETVERRMLNLIQDMKPTRSSSHGLARPPTVFAPACWGHGMLYGLTTPMLPTNQELDDGGQFEDAVPFAEDEVATLFGGHVGVFVQRWGFDKVLGSSDLTAPRINGVSLAEAIGNWTLVSAAVVCHLPSRPGLGLCSSVSCCTDAKHWDCDIGTVMLWCGRLWTIRCPGRSWVSLWKGFWLATSTTTWTRAWCWTGPCRRPCRAMGGQVDFLCV